MAESRTIQLEITSDATAVIKKIEQHKQKSLEIDTKRLNVAKEHLKVKNQQKNLSAGKSLSKDGADASVKKLNKSLKNTEKNIDKVIKKNKKAEKSIEQVTSTVEAKFKSSIRTMGVGMTKLAKDTTKSIKKGMSDGLKKVFSKDTFKSVGKKGLMAGGAGILGGLVAMGMKGATDYDEGIEAIAMINEQASRFEGMLGKEKDPKIKSNLELIEKRVNDLSNIKKGGVSKDKAMKWFANILEVYKSAMGDMKSNEELIETVYKNMWVGINVAAQQNRSVEDVFMGQRNLITSGREMANSYALGGQQAISIERAKNIFVERFRKKGFDRNIHKTDDKQFMFKKEDFMKLSAKERNALIREADMMIWGEKGARAKGASQQETQNFLTLASLVKQIQGSKDPKEIERLKRKAKALNASTSVGQSVKENIRMQALIQGLQAVDAPLAKASQQAEDIAFYDDLLKSEGKLKGYAEGVKKVGVGRDELAEGFDKGIRNAMPVVTDAIQAGINFAKPTVSTVLTGAMNILTGGGK